VTEAAETLLACRGLTVRFGGLEALSDFSLAVRKDQVLGIAGPNGAGKTTLFNAISGHVRPASGTVSFCGRTITGLPPELIFQQGLARTFQNPEIIASQSIHANVLVGAHFARDAGLSGMLAFPPASFATAWQALESFGLVERRDLPAGRTALFERKIVMIASAMAHTPRILLLDEPAAGLTPDECSRVLDVIARVRGLGTTVVLIEHVMRVLMAAADRVVVLNRGSLVFDGTPESARGDEEVRRIYFGRGAS
jgi:ABC-type branched-subunit amino acid transport system ATPase component